MKLNGISLFSNVGIAETYLEKLNVNIVIANEIIKERARFYSHLYPKVDMLIGDITDKEIYNRLIKKAIAKNVEFLIATPPCQGMSIAGKMDSNDPRNQLIYYAIKAIKDIRPKYVLLENVPRQLKTKIIIDKKEMLIPEYLKLELMNEYNFANENIVSAKDYGVPQMRKRNIMLLSRKDMEYIWQIPKPYDNEITLREALKGIPSIDPYLKEGLEQTIKMFPDFEKKKMMGLNFSKWHYPPTHSKKLVETMMHTPSGCTAFDNEIYYPKKDDGTRVNGHYNTYRRHNWDKPSRTITQNNAVISSLCCVHPGYKISDEKTEHERIYSDARCFSIYELLVVTSLPVNWNIPEWASDKLIRSVIGEGIPPLLVYNIVKNLMDNI